METASNAFASTFDFAPVEETKEAKATPKKVTVAGVVEQVEAPVAVTKPATVEFTAMMESFIYESSEKAVAIVEKEVALALKKAGSSNWIGGFALALLGPPDFKDINKQCGEEGVYCGTYWN